MIDDLPPCEDCGQQRPIMLAMEPGIDGKEWRLCSPCYRQGAFPKKAERPSYMSKHSTPTKKAAK